MVVHKKFPDFDVPHSIVVQVSEVELYWKIVSFLLANVACKLKIIIKVVDRVKHLFVSLGLLDYWVSLAQQRVVVKNVLSEAVVCNFDF